MKEIYWYKLGEAAVKNKSRDIKNLKRGGLLPSDVEISPDVLGYPPVMLYNNIDGQPDLMTYHQELLAGEIAKKSGRSILGVVVIPEESCLGFVTKSGRLNLDEVEVAILQVNKTTIRDRKNPITIPNRPQ